MLKKNASSENCNGFIFRKEKECILVRQVLFYLSHKEIILEVYCLIVNSLKLETKD